MRSTSTHRPVTAIATSTTALRRARRVRLLPPTLGLLGRSWLIVLAGLLSTGCAGNHFAGHDAQSGGTGESGGGGTSPTGTTPSVAFDAASPASAVRKVKMLLTGQTAGSDELAQVAQDPNELASLVDAWMNTDAYKNTLFNFFGNAFQQSGVLGSYFPYNLYGRENYYPSPTLLLAIRESFARTALALVEEGAPFTETLTTSRYMMTTELMSFYAYTETSKMADDLVYFPRFNRWQQNGVTKFSLRYAGGPLALKTSADPTSSLYLTFYQPNLLTAYPSATAAVCKQFDPLPFTNERTFASGAQWGENVWALMQGAGWNNYDPPTNTLCQGAGTGQSWYKASDLNDWRMVTVRRPLSNEYVHEMFDLDTLRAGNVLIVDSPRIGFMTTPAFLSQWSTNVSNSSRALANQVMIVALGGQVDGSDHLALTNPSAVDPNHANDAACFACHQTLDPLRQFFRQSFTLTGSPQNDANQRNIPATMSFRGQVVSGTGVEDWAAALAAHPLYATAWTVKVCSWANSAPCAADDPEVLRIAADFKASNYNFNRLVRDVMTSPLVTYLQATATATQTSAPHVSMTRRVQLCAALDQRLGLSDVCSLSTATPDGQDTIPSRAAVVPQDNYARGQTQDQMVTVPDPFYVANVENICALAAKQVVNQNTKLSSSDPNAAIDTLMQQLMGLDPNQASPVADALHGHFDGATATGADADVALRSTFVVACTSAMVTGIGM